MSHYVEYDYLLINDDFDQHWMIYARSSVPTGCAARQAQLLTV